MRTFGVVSFPHSLFVVLSLDPSLSSFNSQLKKMKSKLKFLDHLELIMDAEEQVMEGVKETILQERISVLQCAFGDGITKRWDNMYVK